MQVDLQVTALRCVQVLQGEQGTWRARRPEPCSEPVEGSEDLKTDQRRLCARLSVTSLSDVGGRGMWMETIVHVVHSSWMCVCEDTLLRQESWVWMHRCAWMDG